VGPVAQDLGAQLGAPPKPGRAGAIIRDGVRVTAANRAAIRVAGVQLTGEAAHTTEGASVRARGTGGVAGAAVVNLVEEPARTVATVLEPGPNDLRAGMAAGTAMRISRVEVDARTVAARLAAGTGVAAVATMIGIG
jgi:hypothetical protein